MGTITINNKDEFCVSESNMEMIGRWLEQHGTKSPFHFLEGREVAGRIMQFRPLCGALSTHGTVDESKVTCSYCKEYLGKPQVRNALQRKGWLTEAAVEEKPRRVSARRRV